MRASATFPRNSADTFLKGIAAKLHIPQKGEHGLPDGLTPREAEVLALMAEGKSVPTIAEELVLGATTVKTHVGHLYEKLGVSDRAAAVAEAMRRRLIE